MIKMIFASIFIPGALLAAAPTYSETATVTIGAGSAPVSIVVRDATLSVSNRAATLPVYTFTPAPERFVLPSGLAASGGVVTPTASPGVCLVTAVVNQNGRSVGHQYQLTYENTRGTNFLSYTAGTLNHELWTNYLATTNGRTATLWTNRNAGAGGWNVNNFLNAATNAPALSFAWEGQGAPGQIPITAISARLGYTRGHGMGASGTNTANAGKEVWFARLPSGIVTNTIAEQITQYGAGDDYTLFRFASDLPSTVRPAPVADWDSYTIKRPRNGSAPTPLWHVAQGNVVYSDVAPDSFPGVTPGDSGSPRFILEERRLVLLYGAASSVWSISVSNHARALLRRGGLSLDYMPQVVTFDSYATP